MNNIKKERFSNSRPLFAAEAFSFFLDEKRNKKSRKNDASPLKANAWPAVLSGLRSLDSGKWGEVGVRTDVQSTTATAKHAFGLVIICREKR